MATRYGGMITAALFLDFLGFLINILGENKSGFTLVE